MLLNELRVCNNNIAQWPCRSLHHPVFVVQENLKEISNWQLLDNSISKDFTFKNFSAAFAFMTQIAMAAEKLNHHPELKYMNGSVPNVRDTF